MKNTFFLSSLIVFFLHFAFQSFSQKQSFEGGSLYALVQDGTTYTTVTKKPLGREVLLTYDIFFKNYSVAYFDSDGKIAGFDFNYISDCPDKTCAIYSGRGEARYYVSNLIDAIGTINFMMDQKTDGMIFNFRIEGLVKK